MFWEYPPVITLPANLSDEAAAELLEFLYELTRVFQNYYAAQIRRNQHNNKPHPSELPVDRDPPF